MADITFDSVWNNLKNENEESRVLFQTAEDVARVINQLIVERERQGISQRDLAKRCGLKQSAIARMESIKSIPRLDTVLKVADALGQQITLEDKPTFESVAVYMPQSFVKYSKGFNPTEYVYTGMGSRIALAQTIGVG